MDDGSISEHSGEERRQNIENWTDTRQIYLKTFNWWAEHQLFTNSVESLILAQDERWRRA